MFAMLDFSVDFVTHCDFFETYVAKIQYRFNELCREENTEANFIEYGNQLIQPLSAMTMMLVKMSLQCLDFCNYSQSIIVLASLYASTAFVKHSKTYRGDFTNRFCQYVRRIIFEILQDDLIQQKKVLEER